MFRVRPQFSIILLLAGLLSGTGASCLPVYTSRSAGIAHQARIPQLVDQEISLPWGQDEAVLLIVDKSCKTLQRYHYGQLIRTYPLSSAGNQGENDTELIDVLQPACTRLLANDAIRVRPVLCSQTIHHHQTSTATE